MKRLGIILLSILCVIFLLTGCQRKVTYILADDQIEQICIDELTKHYNPDSSESKTISIDNIKLNWLCDSRGVDSHKFKVICCFDLTSDDFQLKNVTAMIKFSYGTHDRLLMSSEVNLSVLE